MTRCTATMRTGGRTRGRRGGTASHHRSPHSPVRPSILSIPTVLSQAKSCYAARPPSLPPPWCLKIKSMPPPPPLITRSTRSCAEGQGVVGATPQRHSIPFFFGYLGLRNCRFLGSICENMPNFGVIQQRRPRLIHRRRRLPPAIVGDESDDLVLF